MHNEIVIGDMYTSLIQTDDKLNAIRTSDTPVEFNPLIRQRTITTQHFMDLFNKRISSIEHDIFPNNCKYIHNIGSNRKLFIIEEPPSMRTIKVDLSVHGLIEKMKKTGKLEEYGYENYINELDEQEKTEGYYKFQLAFPYVILMIIINQSNQLCSIRPFFRIHPLTSTLDYLFRAPLYNIPMEQTMCMGNTVESFDSVARSVEAIVESFWIRIYNFDYTHNVELYQKSEAFEVMDYLTWMHYSRIDPMFIYNVKWVPYEQNVAQVISHIKSCLRKNTMSSSDHFYTFYNTVYNAKSSKTKSDPKKDEETLNNLTLSIAIGNDIISIGDELIVDKEKYILYSILGNLNGNYRKIELMNKDNEITVMDYNKFKDDYKEKIDKNIINEATVNGIDVKVGDIIVFKLGHNKFYKTIESLRYSPNGKVEAMLTREHYILDNINFELFDVGEIFINDEPIDIKKKYYLVTRQESYSTNMSFEEVIFRRYDINNNGKIFLIFNRSDGANTYSIDYEKVKNGDTQYSFAKEDSYTEPPVACVYDRLLYNKFKDFKFKILKNRGFGKGTKYATRDFYIKTLSEIEEVAKEILIEDGTRLFIPSMTVDIDFKVGDPIIYANWQNPNDMLLISSIKSFEYDNNHHIIYVNAETLNQKKKFKIPFINLVRSKVKVGMIRKVISNFGPWSSGDKLRAKTAGISAFPKKDVNTIIAIINDGSTKYPMALMSNLCTLWVNDYNLENFENFKYKSPNWKKFENKEFEPEKISYQHGDMMKYYDDNDLDKNTYVISARTSSAKDLSIHVVSNSLGFDYWDNTTKTNLDNYFKRFGILAPRFATTISNMSTLRKAWPNLLGGFITTDRQYGIHFKVDQFKEDF